MYLSLPEVLINILNSEVLLLLRSHTCTNSIERAVLLTLLLANSVRDKALCLEISKKKNAQWCHICVLFRIHHSPIGPFSV